MDSATPPSVAKSAPATVTARLSLGLPPHMRETLDVKGLLGVDLMLSVSSVLFVSLICFRLFYLVWARVEKQRINDLFHHCAILLPINLVPDRITDHEKPRTSQGRECSAQDRGCVGAATYPRDVRWQSSSDKYDNDHGEVRASSRHPRFQVSADLVFVVGAVGSIIAVVVGGLFGAFSALFVAFHSR